MPLTDDSLPTRNQAREFARRTLVNLEFIKAARERSQPVHPVTQLANSLLGLIVYPVENAGIGKLESTPLTQLQVDGWPLWTIHQDDEPPMKKPPTDYKTTTLGRLLRHLRNGIAHRRLRFSSDGPTITDVSFHAEDSLKSGSPVYWRASIEGPDLLDFCIRLAHSIESD